MNRNVMIVLAGGFLIAVLVALLVQASLSGGKKAEPVVLEEEPKVKIIVASQDLKIGTELSDENMKWQEWPKKAVFSGAVVREEEKLPSEMMSGRLRRVVKAGEPIVESALVPEAEGNFLAASLDEGKRAFSIKVGSSGMVSGFVGPGDYVDILLTYSQSVRYTGTGDRAAMQELIQRNINRLATETILQNVKVLAVDQTVARAEEEEDSKDSKKKKSKIAKTVTLEVDYKGAETLAMATELGTLNLALRRLGDETVLADRPPVTTDARVTTIYDEVVDEIKSEQDNAGQNADIVRIYRGDLIQDISVSP